VARTARRPSLPDAGTIPRTWIGSYPPGVPPTYQVPDVTLSRFLDDAARDFPDRDAVVVDGHATSFVTLRDRVDQLATALRDAGIRAGDRVLVALPLGRAGDHRAVRGLAVRPRWRCRSIPTPAVTCSPPSPGTRRSRPPSGPAGRSGRCTPSRPHLPSSSRCVGTSGAPAACVTGSPRPRRWTACVDAAGCGSRSPTTPATSWTCSRRPGGAASPRPPRRATPRSSPTGPVPARSAGWSSATPTWSPTPSRDGCGSRTSRPAVSACWSPTRSTSPCRSPSAC
jgi:hypothetical protein